MSGAISKRRFARRMHSALPLSALLLATSVLLLAPSASADLTIGSERVYPVCTNSDLCQLSTDPIGEATLSGSTQSATPLDPVTIRKEFRLLPVQHHLALLPTMMEEMRIDLRIQEDPTSWSQPDLVVELRLGDSWNQWTIEGGGFGLPEQQQPYLLTDATLALDNGRILQSGDPVILTLSFSVDRPVTWELHLAGESWFDLPIDWSLDPDSVNIDEPSSITDPAEVDPSRHQYGALIGADVDCFAFNLPEDLALFTISMRWDDAPVEVEQSMVEPTMRTANGRDNPAPVVRTTIESGETHSEVKWAEPRGGEQHLCWKGEPERYQSYRWIGQMTRSGLGATSPSDFSGIAAWPTGEGWAGSTSETREPDSQGFALLLFGGFFSGLAGIALALPSGAWWTRRIAIPFALVLILAGGVASPAWALTSSMPKSGEDSLDELLAEHVRLVGDSVASEDPLRSAGFLGTSAGDRVKLRLHIDGAHPTADGRWQLHAMEIDGLRIDDLVYAEASRRSLGEHDEVAFMLQAGRQIAFDLLMLEALLVVDERPAAEVLHIDWTMVSAQAAGSETNPVWTTRPSEVPATKWDKLVRDLYPELLSISYCDCGLDSLDISVRGNSAFDQGDLATPSGLQMSQGLIPYATYLMMLGVLILVATQMHGRVSSNEARRVAEELGGLLAEKEARRRKEEETAIMELPKVAVQSGRESSVSPPSNDGQSRIVHEAKIAPGLLSADDRDLIELIEEESPIDVIEGDS